MNIRSRMLLLAVLAGVVAFAGCAGDGGSGGETFESADGPDGQLIPGEGANENIANQTPMDAGAGAEGESAAVG